MTPKTEAEMRKMGFFKLDAYREELRAKLTGNEKDDAEIIVEIARIDDMMKRLS